MNHSLRIRTPVSERQIRQLNVGDVVYVTGNLVTARDQAHKRMVRFIEEGKKMPIDLDGLGIYHCGPIVTRVNDGWVVVSAGPTTSMRMEPFESEIIRSFNVRLVIGKGGMGRKTEKAMRDHGAAYGAYTGGAAVLAAKSIKRVKLVEWLDLGTPEALWVFEVENFGPLTISIDAHGGNLYTKVRRDARKNAQKLSYKG
jgi:fumarate hydratase subunit beta